MEFPPSARIDTRLTVPDWPAAPDEQLAQAVFGVTTFELANDTPAIVEDGATRHLAWRGYVTGGLMTLYERLGALLSSRGLGAFYSDPRLEVFVPADGDVVVLGALRYPVRLLRGEWDARVNAADSVDNLAATFVHAALAGAGQVIEDARRAAEEDDSHPLVVPRPELIEQLAPGEVDYELLDDSDFELTEQYDPEGNLEDSWVSCHVLRWRTDFVPPGTVRAPDERLEQAQTWRVSQWEWIPEEADDENDDVRDGQWMLRGYAPVSAVVAAEHLPEALQDWVRRMTQEAIGLFEAVAEEDPAFAAAVDQLRKQLPALG